MPRGADHRLDYPDVRRLYREFDTEDLVRILGWLSAISESRFTVEQIRAVSGAATAGYTWSVKRVRRLMRVGVELGWFRQMRLSPNNHLAFELTGEANKIVSLESERIVNLCVKELGVDAAEAREVRRNMMVTAFKSRALFKGLEEWL